MDPILVSVEEAGRLLGIGRSAAYELIASGDLPRVKIGRRTLVPVAACREYVSRHLEGAGMGTPAASAA